MEIDMKKIGWFFNMIFYMLYKFDLKLHMLFNYINPFRLIYKIKSIDRFYRKHGVSNMGTLIDNSFSNKVYGISIVRAGGFLFIPILMVEYGCFNFLQLLLDKPLISLIFGNTFYLIAFLALLVFPAGFLLHRLLYRNDLYLKYFKEFESLRYQTNLKYRLITLGVFLFPLLFLILSFHVMPAI